MMSGDRALQSRPVLVCVGGGGGGRGITFSFCQSCSWVPGTLSHVANIFFFLNLDGMSLFFFFPSGNHDCQS